MIHLYNIYIYIYLVEGPLMKAICTVVDAGSLSGVKFKGSWLCKYEG